MHIYAAIRDILWTEKILKQNSHHFLSQDIHFSEKLAMKQTPGGTSKLRMHRHKNKITRLYYRLPYTYELSEILCTQATEPFNHFSYLLNKFFPLAGRSTT